MARRWYAMCYGPSAVWHLNTIARSSMGSSLRLSRDSRRRSALAAQGLEIRSITASQLENVFEFQETILHAFRAAGCDFKRLNGKQLDRHMRLRSELRKCV